MLNNIVDPERFERLVEINKLLNSEYKDIKRLLSRIVESAASLISCPASSLLLYHAELNRLKFEVAVGEKSEAVKLYTLKPDEGLAGWVYTNKSPAIVNNPADDDRFFSTIDKKEGFSSEAILAVPMFYHEKCVGVLEFIHSQFENKFTEDDLFWAEIIANQAAISLKNARDYQTILKKSLDKIAHTDKRYEIIYESREMEQLLKLCEKVSLSDSPVLITGESGTGKELIANKIHSYSKRAEGPYIAINCASIPDSLLEAELFGYVKGAFTDAHKDHLGKFAIADGGSLFLDEIAEMGTALQAKLLRVLESGYFEPLGATTQSFSDVRIISATNKNLENMIKKNHFRSDLYFRINVFPLHIQPLSKRVEDIIPLAKHFLKQIDIDGKKELSIEAVEWLERYGWPGNVRELRNSIERAVSLSANNVLIPEDFILDIEKDRIDCYNDLTLKDAVINFKKDYVLNLLKRMNYNQTKTAAVLDIQRTYLSRMMKELDISREGAETGEK